MVRLKDICDVDWGDTNLTKQAYVENGKYLGVSAGGCDGRMDYYDFEAYTPVISAIGANCGKMFLPEEPFVAIKNTITLKPHKDILGKYIFYALNSNKIPHRGGGQPFISKTDTEEYMIICPSLEEQTRIVTIFDKVCKTIDMRHKQLSKLDELVKSRFVELFRAEEYPNTTLIELIIEDAGLSYGIVVPGDNVEEGVPMIRPSDFKNDNLCLNNVYRVSPEIEAKYAKTRLIGDEILVQVIGQPGQIMLSDIRCKGMNVTRNLAVVRPDCNKINRIYLKTYMQTPEAQAFMLGETKQSTLKQLPLGRLKELEVPVPPIELQNQFATFVEQTDKSKFEIQKSLEKLETLKKALMQKYFV